MEELDKITITIPRQVGSLLKEVAEKQGRSVDYVIEQALVAYLEYLQRTAA